MMWQLLAAAVGFFRDGSVVYHYYYCIPPPVGGIHVVCECLHNTGAVPKISVSGLTRIDHHGAYSDGSAFTQNPGVVSSSAYLFWAVGLCTSVLSPEAVVSSVSSLLKPTCVVATFKGLCSSVPPSTIHHTLVPKIGFVSSLRAKMYLLPMPPPQSQCNHAQFSFCC